MSGLAPAQEAQLEPVAAARTARIGLAGGGVAPLLERMFGASRRARDAQPRASARHFGKSSSAGDAGPRDVALRALPNASENAPSVVVKPGEPRVLVAAMQLHGESAVRCVAHSSHDGGRTWSGAPRVLPQLASDSQCADPVLAYAPDGSRVYLAYLDVRSALRDEFRVLVSHSDDDGETFSDPVVALGGEGFDYDKPWIATHVPGSRWQNRRNRNWVYVAATRFGLPGPCAIDFARSADQGELWSDPITLDESSGSCGSSVTLEGARPAAGPGAQVVVAWYHSADDGHLVGDFEIRTAYSADRGAAFDAVAVAVREGHELPFYLGPDGAYQRWWTAMFPAVEFAPDGSAHILYTVDPDPDPASEEDGDIRYLASPDGKSWSAPVTLNDDASGKAQGRAALAVVDAWGVPLLYALWEDHRDSEVDNLSYDVYAARGFGHVGWGANWKLSREPSTVDFSFAGDAFSLAAGRRALGPPFVYGVWTDRRHQSDPFEVDDNVFGARVSP